MWLAISHVNFLLLAKLLISRLVDHNFLALVHFDPLTHASVRVIGVGHIYIYKS